jgi:dual specificity phosphatase 12
LLDFEKTYAFIEDGVNKGNILIHCRGGYSRSPSILIAYLMKKYSWKFEQAFNNVKKIKKDISPNNGFIEILKGLDKPREDFQQRKITEYIHVKNKI